MRTPLEATGTWYCSQNDEAAFFEWADKISCITRYYGVGRTLFLEIDRRKVSSANLREILALFCRYHIDMKQLRTFDHPKFAAWFRAPEAYWHEAVFGKGEPANATTQDP